MKVLLVNGSPHKEGCTFTALSEVAKTLNEEGIETQIFQIGTKPILGCLACQKYLELGKCVINDRINECLEIADKYDGFAFGTAVYYASANGAMSAFMDRLFISNLCSGKECFYLKPAAYTYYWKMIVTRSRRGAVACRKTTRSTK